MGLWFVGLWLADANVSRVSQLRTYKPVHINTYTPATIAFIFAIAVFATS